MTEHLLQKDTVSDRRAMARIGYIVACFLAFTVLLAVGVGLALS